MGTTLTLTVDDGIPDRAGALAAEGGKPVAVRVISMSAGEIVMAVALPPGHFKGVLRTRRGQFPMDSLRLPLLEWPTLKRVPCGPFDIDHTENRMVVPCYHVQVDDQAPGLAWFDLPSAEMEEQRYVETEFGFAVSSQGEHRLRLAFREGETRLGWGDVESIRLAPDERQPQSCPVRPDADLWTDAARWDALSARPSALQTVMRESLRHTARSGLSGTYTFRIVLLAILHRLGETEWRDELRSRVLELLDRPYWGFHTVEGELGCDNDRDASLRLMQMSVAYAWAADAFPADTRARIRAKLLHHGHVLYRFTILQKAYWPDTTIEAHGLGGWLGLATAAAALHREAPEVRPWLDWCYGNFLRNAGFLPRDGFNPWPIFNTHWAVYLLALFENLTGARLLKDNPFFASYGPLLRDMLAMGLHGPLTDSGGGGGLREDVAVMGYLGARQADDRVTACAAAGVRAIAQAGAHLPPLTLVWVPGDPPPAPPAAPVPRTLHTRSGHVATFDAFDGRSLRLEFTCGSPQGPENAPFLNRYMQFHNHMGFSGNYTLALDGVPVVSGPGGSYDYRTDLFQMVAIEGGGHIIEHRYGGFRLKPTEQPGILFLRDSNDLLYVQADLRPAYRAGLPLVRAVRHLCLVRGRGIVVVVDDLAATAPLRFSHHLSTPGTIEADGPAHWRIKSGRAELCLAALMPAGARASAGKLAYVPTYSLGLNAYKSRDWQPEVHARVKEPPRFWQLVHALAAPAAAFLGGVVYAPRPLDLQWTRPDPTGFCLRIGAAALDVDVQSGAAHWREG